MSFVDERAAGRDAKGLTAAVAIHGGLLAAVLLAPAAVQQLRAPPPPIEAVNVVPLDPPPLPPELELQPETPAPPAPPAPPLFSPKPIVDIPLPPVQQPRASPDPQPIPLPAPGFLPGGTGTVAIARLEPTPSSTSAAPVLRDATRDPRYANNFQPPYPSALLRRELEGSATVRVLIGPDGHVSKVEIVTASHPDFGAATQKQALVKWRFQPATRGGVPVPSWQTLTVRFTITS